MKHWHRCRRWHQLGLTCPFTDFDDHDDDTDDDPDQRVLGPEKPKPVPVPIPTAPLRFPEPAFVQDEANEKIRQDRRQEMVEAVDQVLEDVVRREPLKVGEKVEPLGRKIRLQDQPEARPPGEDGRPGTGGPRREPTQPETGGHPARASGGPSPSRLQDTPELRDLGPKARQGAVEAVHDLTFSQKPGLQDLDTPLGQERAAQGAAERAEVAVTDTLGDLQAIEPRTKQLRPRKPPPRGPVRPQSSRPPPKMTGKPQTTGRAGSRGFFFNATARLNQLRP